MAEQQQKVCDSIDEDQQNHFPYQWFDYDCFVIQYFLVDLLSIKIANYEVIGRDISSSSPPIHNCSIPKVWCYSRVIPETIIIDLSRTDQKEFLDWERMMMMLIIIIYSFQFQMAIIREY